MLTGTGGIQGIGLEPGAPLWLPWIRIGAGFLVGLVFAWASIRWMGPLGFLDHPGGRKVHPGPVPRVGGIALVASLGVGLALGMVNLQLSWAEWGLVCALGLVGAWDDRRGLSASFKAKASFLVALALAVLALKDLNLGMGNFLFAGLPLPSGPWVLGLLLVLLFWGTPQALNLIDGANGLLLGYALVVMGLAAAAGRPPGFMTGVLFALFLLNWPRARLFMGDCGSLVLGLLLAHVAREIASTDRLERVLWVLAYPAVDLCTVVATRLLLRRPLGVGDRNHLHHHWINAFGRRGAWAIPLLWGLAALCGAGAVLAWPWRFLAWGGLVFLVASSAWFVFQTVRGRWQRGSSAAVAAK